MKHYAANGPSRTGSRRSHRPKTRLSLTNAAHVAGLSLLASSLLLAGCSRLRPKPAPQYVYVTAKQQFLRDRVAAVSNRTATVENGERLQVLERGRRFLRVQTPTGETGWIDEKTVASQQVDDAFVALAHEHQADLAVATAVVRDEVYLHLTPGRATERFYRLAEGDKLSLLKRATLPKGGGAASVSNISARQAAIPGAATGIAAKPNTAANVAATTKLSPPPPAKPKDTPASATAAEPEPPPMEDWWLVRDGKGQVGWMLSRMMDIDAPYTLARYAEGQRIVGAYILATAYDAEAPDANKDVPEYVTVLSPYKAGLPYDFDQVRVFTWNPKMHRYETAFREKNVEGYLPVEITKLTDPNGRSASAATPLPGFRYKVLSAAAPPVIPDPITGAIVPGETITKTYRLEGNVIRRVLAPGTAAPEEAHPEIIVKKKPEKHGRR